MFDSIGRYHEVRPDGPRQFELFKDRLVIECRSAGLDSEVTIILADLRPEPNRLLVRPKGSKLGLFMLIGSAVAAFTGLPARGSAFILSQKAINSFLGAGILLFLAMVIFWKTARKIKFLRFVSHNGHSLFDIAKAGPHRVEFDPFVHALIDGIRANQKNDRPAPADS